MKTYKAKGIVLHTIKYGDSSLVAYLLTDTRGRQSYMVQGVRSTRGHGNKGALLQPMFVLEFEGTESPRTEMHRIREMRAAVPLRTVPFDVRKSTVALFMAETLYRLVREVEANSPLFDFVEGAVTALDAMDDGVANFHLWFMVALSRHLGFFPGNEWCEGSWFDIREGIFTPIQPRGAFFSRENAALLGRLMDIPTVVSTTSPSQSEGTPPYQGGEFPLLPEGGGVAFPSEANRRAESDRGGRFSLADLPLNRTRRVDFLNSMLAYFDYHLEATRDIRSVDILREVF